MEEKKFQPKKLSLSNTKQEMLEAYSAILKQLEAQREAELKPEKKLEEKKAKEVIQVADSLSSEGVAKEISNLKIETGKVLAQISDRLEEEIGKFKAVQNAIVLKEKELQELYEIEKSAMTLAALIESQNQKRQVFESEMAEKKEALSQEIETLRAEREHEKQENELNELRKKVGAFPKEMEAAMTKAIKETTEKLNLEAKNREELQKREFIGERNVLTTRIESLEKMVKEQSEQITKLTQQLEKAYQQVQDIAVKTIEGSSNIKSFANLQQWISEQMRKSPQEK